MFAVLSLGGGNAPRRPASQPLRPAEEPSRTLETEGELGPYLQSLPERSLRSLSLQEEVDLAQRIERGDQQAREDLVLSNLRLVIAIAKLYTGHGLPLSDLVQEGNLGLLKAIPKYDWRKGFRFSTYAVYWVRQSISQALKEQRDAIVIPSHILDESRLIARARQKLLLQNGTMPGEEEIAALLGKPLLWVQVRDHLPEAVPLEEGEDNPLQPPPAPRNLDGLEEKLRSLLSERSFLMVCQFYGVFGQPRLTLRELKREHHISAGRVHQLLQDALKKLQKAAEEDGDLDAFLLPPVV